MQGILVYHNNENTKRYVYLAPITEGFPIKKVITAWGVKSWRHHDFLIMHVPTVWNS